MDHRGRRQSRSRGRSDTRSVSPSRGRENSVGLETNHSRYRNRSRSVDSTRSHSPVRGRGQREDPALPERAESDQEARDAAAIPLPIEQEPLLPKSFQLDKYCSKELRTWMTTPQKPEESKQLRENFIPTFEKSSFDLQVPKLDPSMARRLKEVREREASKAEVKKKSLSADQYKISEIGKPFLYVLESAVVAAVVDPLMVSAAESALQLLGHAFHNITIQRRENILWKTDHHFESLLAESTRFKPKECALLFGRTFLRGMVKDFLPALGCPGGQPSTSTSGRHGKGGGASRGVKVGDQDPVSALTCTAALTNEAPSRALLTGIQGQFLRIYLLRHFLCAHPW